MSFVEAVLLLISLIAGLFGLALIKPGATRLTNNLAQKVRLTLLFFNLLTVIGLGLNYLSNDSAFQLQEYPAALMGLLLIMSVFKIGFVHSLLGVSLWLRNKELSKKANSYLYSIYAALLTALAVGVLASGLSGYGHGADIAIVLFEILISGSILTISTQLLLAVKSPGSSRSANLFALINLGTVCLLMILTFHPTLRETSYWNGLKACGLLLYNLLLILWALKYHAHLVTASDDRVRKFGLSEKAAQFGISKRELEVVELICQGRTNQEIADRLFISLQTVKDHNHNIFRKVGVSNRTQLAARFTSIGKSD
jgi:DNA-binding CsgD family transcriptional regulator